MAVIIKDPPGAAQTDTYTIMFEYSEMVAGKDCIGHIDNTERGKCKLYLYNGFCEELVATYTSLDECKTALVKKLAEGIK